MTTTDLGRGWIGLDDAARWLRVSAEDLRQAILDGTVMAVEGPTGEVVDLAALSRALDPELDC